MSDLQITIENIGGIDHLETSIEEGVSLITGENASNKTSLLHGILFGFGAEEVPVRADADQARVELSYQDRTVERTARRHSTSITTDGDSWIGPENALRFERFAGLLETNPLRTAVQTSANVESLLKEPMDIQRLERKRSQKLDRKREIQARIDELGAVEDDLETKRSTLERRRDAVTTLEAELEDLYEETPNDDELSELRERRAELVSERDGLDDQIENLTTSVERIEEEIEDLESEIEETETNVASYEIGTLRSKRAERRAEVDEIDERIDVVQSVLTANREMLNADVRDILDYESGLDEDHVECWACGQTAPVSTFEDAVDRLSDLVGKEKQRRQEKTPEIEEIEAQIEAAENASRDLERFEADLQSSKSKLASRRESIEEKREQLAAVDNRIAEVEDEITAAQAERAADQSEVTETIEETRVSLEAKRRDVERLEREINDLKEQKQERADLETELESLTAEIQGITDRIEHLESDLREAFNGAMDDLMDVLAFEGVERLWLDGEFDLVIAREIDGNIREDSPENLAESERETIGLVLGLAGYLAYDVAEVAPVLVLDSLGAFDADRTRRVVDYFSDHADLLLAAIHPEQAVDMTDGYRKYSPDAPA
jgi:chromosome segregation ATPase